MVISSMTLLLPPSYKYVNKPTEMFIATLRHCQLFSVNWFGVIFYVAMPTLSSTQNGQLLLHLYGAMSCA